MLSFELAKCPIGRSASYTQRKKSLLAATAFALAVVLSFFSLACAQHAYGDETPSQSNPASNSESAPEGSTDVPEISDEGSSDPSEANKPTSSGWFTNDDGERFYYTDPGKRPLTGWQKIGKEWYYLQPEKNGALATGTFKANGKYYVTDENGARAHDGWTQIGGKWYYATSNGSLKTGWLKTGGKWYWLDANNNAEMKTGHFRVSGKWYVANGNGALYQKGWAKYGGNWYYATSSGALKKGWLKTGGKWYYLDGSGTMETGKYKVGGKWYISNKSGAMYANRWVKSGGKWCYATSSGALKKGWLKTGGKWYYLDGSAIMKTGWVKVSGYKYFLGSSGAMKTGWLKTGGKWYYLKSSGAMDIGWLKSGGKWYWLEKSGVMAASTTKTIDKKLYSFTSSGAMRANCQIKLPDNVCGYAASSGAISKIGVFKNGSVYLQSSSGKTLTGWNKLAGKWFYADKSGKVKTGWLKTGGKWYWLDSSGAMATGWRTIDGKRYYFNSSGAWTTGGSMAIKAQKYSSGTKYLIMVDRKAHKVGVFTGSKGNWKQKYNWSCVTGASGSPTITGTFHTTGGKRMSLSTDSRARWCTQIAGGYFFHTILASNSELGHSLSHGCIRMAVPNAQWIYKNIQVGTTVVIYN